MGRRTLFWRHAQAARRHFLFVFERLKAVLRPFRTYRAARFAYHFGADPVFRHDQWLRLRRPRYLFQYRSITSPDRYPAIFEFVREGLRDQNEPRMLSFGCASGEEVFTLRDYFPRASVKGIDINPRNIAVCRTRHRERGGDPAILFELNASASNEVACSYDAVFCLAVFQRPKLKEGPEVRSSAPHLLFSDFERVASGLAVAVKPGGYLVLRHSMFRFADTSGARDFRPVLRLPPGGPLFPRFDSTDRRLPDGEDEAVVFKRIPG